MDFEKIYREVGEWSVETFPESGPEIHVKKLKHEAEEVLEDLNDIVEYADCLICIFASAYKASIDPKKLLKAVEEKLEVCKTRTWVLQEDGTHQHVE